VRTPASELPRRLGLTVTDDGLLEEALVHSSYVNEHPELGLRSNERLEFLGDAVLSLLVSERLWHRHPDDPEGLLTARRASVVSTRALARIATRLDLGPAMLMGQGAERSGERRRHSVLAGAFEALLAAVYLDQGLEAARRFLDDAAGPEFEADVPVDALKAPKTRLQEHAFLVSGRAPVYRVVSVAGPDHARHFVVEVSVEGRTLARGEGRSKREAETEAATTALREIVAEATGT
jgi:ribonuclease III